MEQKRKAIELAHNPELTYQQIADMVDVCLASVSRWVREAREKQK